jgi:hypothetical protein
MDTVVALVGPDGMATLERVRVDDWFTHDNMRVVYRYTVSKTARGWWYEGEGVVRGITTYKPIGKNRRIVQRKHHSIIETNSAEGVKIRFLISNMRNVGHEDGPCSYSTPIVGGKTEFPVGSVWPYNIDAETITRIPALQKIARWDVVAELLSGSAAEEASITYDD